MTTHSVEEVRPKAPEEEPVRPSVIAPGSAEARERGCICPEFLNGDGSGLRTAPGAFEDDQYLTHPHCRLHGVL